MTSWTVETLKEHYDQRFIDLDTAVKAALTAAEKAVTKAEIAADKRFELLNELRSGVATKEQLEALEKVVTDLRDRLNSSAGVTAGSQITKTALVSYLLVGFAFVTLVVLLANNVFK
jgi:DNA-binding transcriptional regulator YbjK